MGDTTSRVFALLGLVLCVWVITFWFYEPASRSSVIVDDRPPQDAPLLPTPVLPPPRSLPPAPSAQPQQPPEQPDFAAVPALPPQGPAPVAGPGEVLIPPEFTDYTVLSSDRSLQEIALRMYGDRARWVAIARANPFFTPDKLKPGVTVLRIPKDPDNIQGRLVKVEQPRSPLIPPAVPERAPVQPVPSPSPAIADGWRTYTVQENDTLWGIAKKMYNRPSLTGVIADANTDVLPDPDRLNPGITLKIPPAPPLD